MEEQEIEEGLPEGLVIRTILNNSYDTIYFKDMASRFILNSRAHAMQFGVWTRNNFLERMMRISFQTRSTNPPIAMNRRSSGPAAVDRSGGALGPPSWDRVLADGVQIPDDNGEIIGTWGTSRDITALKEAETQLENLNRQLQEANERLEVLSTRDSLSGLFNHRHFTTH